MVEMTKKETAYWWWFDSHQHSSRRSSWLQSTLGDLDKKTKTMLKLIEEDADSFAQRAEMYYKKRPELISMVEDFYKTHRSLAERYDLLKSESASRLLTTLGSPFSAKYQQPKLMAGRMDQFDHTYDSHYETATNDSEDSSAESEVDDPEQEPENKMGEVEHEEPEHEVKETKENEFVGVVVYNDEVMKLREEIERLNEENRIQKDELLQKDEEKREVIRQLSSAVEVLKVENVYLRKYAARNPPKKKSLFEFEKLKDVFSGKLFNGSSRSRGCVVSL